MRAESAPAAATAPAALSAPRAALGDWQALAARVATLPAPVAEMAAAGLRKVVDFQDAPMAPTYLDRLDAVLAQDEAGRGHALCASRPPKHIANAMAYDDIIRVADLKTRPARFARIRAEMAAGRGPWCCT